MPRIAAEMTKVSAMCAHSPPDQRKVMLHALLSQWTRLRNLRAKGKPSPFTHSEITEMLDFLETLISEAQHD